MIYNPPVGVERRGGRTMQRTCDADSPDSRSCCDKLLARRSQSSCAARGSVCGVEPRRSQLMTGVSHLPVGNSSCGCNGKRAFPQSQFHEGFTMIAHTTKHKVRISKDLQRGD